MPRKRERRREPVLYPLRAYYGRADADGDELEARRAADDELAWIGAAERTLEPLLGACARAARARAHQPRPRVARRQAELVARPHYVLRRRGVVDGELQLAYQRVPRPRGSAEDAETTEVMFPWGVDADMSVFTRDTHALALTGRVVAWWPTRRSASRSGGGGARLARADAARGVVVLGSVTHGGL